jgi:hypothetical protein
MGVVTIPALVSSAVRGDVDSGNFGSTGRALIMTLAAHFFGGRLFRADDLRLSKVQFRHLVALRTGESGMV